MTKLIFNPQRLWTFFIFLSSWYSDAFQLSKYTCYLDYLAQEPLLSINDFRTEKVPPLHLRDRGKMKIPPSIKDIETVLDKITWPKAWPYSFEDFRPLDYTRDEVFLTDVQYEYSQSLMESNFVTVIPGLLRLPCDRHFIYPKDQVALGLHLSDVIKDGDNVLELFSCHKSILPANRKLGTTVGIGWYEREMECNSDLDDYIVQDVSVDPFLPLTDNYFDVVTVPAMFQLVQRPLDLFQEINRVLKPGGVAVFGVKLTFWSFLGWKQGRYYVETNYLEDIVALASFFHYAGGFRQPEIFDLNYPEVTPIGNFKDRFFPNRRLDFYAVVQAVKKKDSPHGRLGTTGSDAKKDSDQENDEDDNNFPKPPEIEGKEFKPKIEINYDTNEYVRSPYY